MAVSQKIIADYIQPNGGRGIVGVAGMRGLKKVGNTGLMNYVALNHIIKPARDENPERSWQFVNGYFVPLPGFENDMDDSISVINAKLDTRFDDQDYYNPAA